MAQAAQSNLKFIGSFSDEDRVNAMLRAASERYHLVSPATAVGSLPEGCEIATSFVAVDGRIGDNGKPLSAEVYDVGGGKLGLAKVALDKIASAMGISWDPISSRRLDDGSDPYYCEFRAVGTMRGFDGSPVTIMGTKEMDLRPASPQVDAITAKVEAKNAKYGGNASGESQIREMRLHILGHAESKARLRAIRSIGIRTSFTPKELERPFLVAKLVFTGRTDDVELGRQFALMRASAMLGGVRALYGAEAPPQVVESPAGPNRSTRGHKPPPVGSVNDFDEEDGEGGAPPPAQSRAASPPAARPSPRPPANGKSGVRVPFGKNKDKLLTEVDDENLDWLANAVSNSVSDPDKERFRDKNQALLDAIHAEQKTRANGGEVDAGADDPTGGYADRGDDPNRY